MDSNATAKSDFWAERILAFQESGLSRRDWCLKNGISQSTFGYWFRKLQTVDSRTGQGGLCKNKGNAPGMAAFPRRRQ